MDTDDPNRPVDARPDGSPPAGTAPVGDIDEVSAAADRADYLDVPGTEEPNTEA